MQGDSPCTDVEVAESGGCCNIGQGSHAGDVVADVVVGCQCRGSRT
jgi:hypothetical protein